MNTIIIANIILWLSIFSWVMPDAIDKQVKNDEVTIIEHKLDITE